MNEMSNQRRWYLIYSKPRMEKQAEENLRRQGFETYLPMVKSRRRRNSRYTTVIEAFFPRYLFIHLDTQTDNWAPIRSTLGVTRMVQFGGVPAIVPNELVDLLKANEDEAGLQMLDNKEIKKGDKVKIIDGPFAGYQGIYHKKKSADRVSILLDIVGKQSEVTISEHDLLLA